MRTKFHATILLIVVLFSAFLTFSCSSVEKYNKQIDKPISVKKLQYDINYVQHLLQRKYPNLYGYISKETLEAKFDSVRNKVDKPMTSKEFFFLLSPVIASVRQGHMTLSPLYKGISKKEQKRLKKAGVGPLSQFEFEWMNNKLYVLKNKSHEKTIKAGTEVVSINAVTPQSIYEKYKSTFTSDGFNTTFLPKFFNKRFSNYVVVELGTNDSLTYEFKQKDSVYSTTIHRFTAEKKAVSIATSTKNSVDKKKKKSEKRAKAVYGFDEISKEYSKSLRFISTDSTIAVMKIKNFSKGIYSIAYDEMFKKIKSKQVKTLIIDLRNNPGGRIADAVKMYSYLTDHDFVMLQKADVTSKTSLWKWGLYNQLPKITYPFISVVYPFYMGYSFCKTKKTPQGYTYSLVGSKKNKSNLSHFSGTIYVLINGGSFSASCLLSANLKSNTNTIFVGEETGGGFNGTVAGIMPIVELPNSKLPMRIGLMNVKPTQQSTVYGRGIFPDKEIVPTIEDKISGKDIELEWILNECEIKNKKQ